MNKIHIRNMTLEDLPILMELKESVGWNQTVWDWLQFLENKEYCWVATIKDQVAGSIAAYSYGVEVAWIGMVIVDQAHRGKGISKLLLDHLLVGLRGKHQVIKLDATPAGIPVYEKFGFIRERTFDRMTCTRLNISGDRNKIMVSLNMDMMASMDLSIMGYSRQRLLRAMNDKYPEYGVGKIVDNRLEGFLLGRDGSKFTQLGPLITSNDKIAIDLLKYSMLKNKPGSVVVDINSEKIHLITWLQQIGFKKERSFTRMYLGKATHVNEQFHYLITGPEFG